MTDLKKGDGIAPSASKSVRVRVLKKGDGKVHKGNGDKYAKGDEFDLDGEIATALEDAGLVDTL